ncbi:MAG TPA: thioredoxin-disulfide reductase [Candidatus Desulfofervidus auxilii]|uniref:Thioredoxin reductase n=1 Tax=Desulfofervidus auxilii TaxID=1621989 RepID=A0A7V0IAM0_DESA2|nr:thioredoxin-disulfide reductase [Candidatus Desulfofervidus auxilii]
MSYEVIVIGAGPAGLTAGIYLARARLKAVILEKLAPGGQVIITTKVENYPGFPEGINGPDLMFLFEKQVRNLGIEIKQAFTVNEIKLEGEKKLIIGEDETLETKAVIIATGARFKKLGVPGEERLIGRGVSYCATCDAPFFQGLDVAVVGGGNTAIVEALHLTKFAKRVYLIHRRDALRAAKALQEEAFKNEKMTFVWNTVVREIKGEEKVEGLILENVKTGEKEELKVNGCFVFIGLVPNSELVKDLVKLDERGYIVTDVYCQSSIAGIFAAGDVRSSPLKQIATAVGDGAIAAVGAEKYLSGWKM